MKRRPSLRVELAPTSDTSILCLVCGRFRCELAVSVPAGEPGMGSFAGVHRKCLRAAREAIRRERSADQAARSINRRFEALALAELGGETAAPDPDPDPDPEPS